jgi:hypothetical protein
LLGHGFIESYGERIVGRWKNLVGTFTQVFPPTLVKEDEALPETADCRMDLTVVLRWGHDERVVYCNPVLRSVN